MIRAPIRVFAFSLKDGWNRLVCNRARTDVASSCDGRLWIQDDRRSRRPAPDHRGGLQQCDRGRYHTRGWWRASGRDKPVPEWLSGSAIAVTPSERLYGLTAMSFALP